MLNVEFDRINVAMGGVCVHQPIHDIFPESGLLMCAILNDVIKEMLHICHSHKSVCVCVFHFVLSPLGKYVKVKYQR